MVFLPLQAVLAAVETYEGNGAEHESVIETVLHSQGWHEHHAENHPAENKQDHACDGDHHHCHAHNVSVLPHLLTFAMLPHVLDQAYERSNGFQSFSSNRIERPKWV